MSKKGGRKVRFRNFHILVPEGQKVTHIPADLPTDERGNHQGGVEIRNGRAYTLEWYPQYLLSRKTITPGQYQAIANLYDTFKAAGIDQLRAAPLEWSPASTGEKISEYHARKRKALNRILGDLTQDHRDVVWWTCLLEKYTLDTYDGKIHKQKGTARARLLGALTCLCQHYHIKPY